MLRSHPRFLARRIIEVAMSIDAASRKSQEHHVCPNLLSGLAVMYAAHHQKVER
jgi:hypothetical protein